jgi:acetyl-CoA acetyltransferase
VAGRLERRPVHMGAIAENHAHQADRLAPDRTVTGFTAIRDRLFADVQRDGLDFLQLYDDYPIAVLKQLEDLGFCDLGDGGPFLERTDIGLGGTLPINTGGGLLSVGQPRLGGGFIPIVEAVRQLRGEAGERQVSGASAGLVSGIGLIDYLGNLVVTSGMILMRDAA